MRTCLIILCFFACGCGYHAGGSSAFLQRVDLGFAAGDGSGQLTNALIYALSSSGRYAYSSKNPQLRLQVAIGDVVSDQIGYRRNRSPDGTVRKSIMPTEGRQTITAQVSLQDLATGKALWGPKKIVADIDYDYIDQDSLDDLSFVNSQGVRQTVLQFSLGQLEAAASAQEAAAVPLYRALAEKIVDLISNANKIAE